MALIRGEGISKSYGDNLLIEKVSFSINEKEKIGLIGRNGVGKTTFLRLISGEIEPEEGKIERKKNLQFGYLPQKVPLSSEKTLYEEVKEVFDEILKLEEKIDNLTTLMSREEGDISHYLKEFDKLQEEFEEKGGYIYEAKIKEVLFGLGFTEDKFKMKISDLSGGEKSRISYSKLLLKSSDLLLLDEPTNHLDIEAIEWLEGFLRDYDKAFVIVSHDRYFLDKVVEKVWEIEERKLKEYRGNYTSYIRKKAEILARREKEYNLQKKQISHLEEFIRRNIGGRAPTQAKSREKRLQKLKRVEKPQKEKKHIKPLALPIEIPDQIINEIKELKGTLEALLIDKNWKILLRIPVKDLAKTLQSTDNISTIIFDGIVTQRIVDIAYEKNIDLVIGARVGDVTRIPEKMKILTFSDII